uniref:leucine-rich repeat domain-containing protein n=1 Tax=Ruminococcus sp. TaxID=41978 RepID=UPI0025D95B84
MLRNRLIAGLLSAVMCTTAVMPNQASNNAGREANAASGKEKAGSSDYDIKSTNSLGNFLKDVAAKNDVSNPLDENVNSSQFQITCLEFDNETGIVRVASNQPTEARIVVSFINDETNENAFSVETTVKEGKLVGSEIKVDASQLPQYYVVKAQLFDQMHRPVGKAYSISRYTKEYQEILATDITAFDQEQVVNLDEDESTNFLVINEDTVKAESSEEQNTLVSADYDNNVFVFDNADESIASLQEGEYLYIQPDEDNIIAVNVDSVEKDGDTVTVSGNDDIDDMFEFIKIESNGDFDKVEIDTSAADEGVSFPNVDENGDVVVSDDGTFEFEYESPQYDLKYDVSASKTFSLDSLLDPTTSDTKPNDPYYDLSAKRADKATGTITISLNFNFFKKFGDTKAELTVKVSPAFTVTDGITGGGFYESSSPKARSLAATIAKIKIPLSIPSTVVEVSPRLFVDFSGKITFSIKWDSVGGFYYENGETEFKAEIFDEKNVDVSLKISGEIYAGLELKLYVEVVSEKIAAIGLDIKAGIRVKAEADLGKIYEQYEKNSSEPPDKVIVDHDKGNWYHACKFCVKATTDFVLKINLDLCVLRKKNSLTLCEFSFNLPFLGLYFSSENGFGVGECDYNRFRTTFMVLNKADMGYIPAVVKLGDKETTVGGSGATFYCLPGSYKYTITYGGETLESGTVTVKNSPLDLEFVEEPKLDDDGNIKDYVNDNSNISTGVSVTKATTTKRVITTQTLPALSFEDDEVIAEAGSLGDHISYMLYPDGYLYACGYGEMYDFSSSPFRDPSIVKYAVIENTGNEKDGGIITSIGNGVFIDCKNMNSINMPQTIKSIGKNAFRGCASLSEVSYDEYDYEKEKVIEVKYPKGKLVMPKAITSIGEYAFSGCASLTDIVIPKTITEIPDRAFSECSSLTAIEVPDNVVKMGQYVFSGCSSLEKAVIKNCENGIGKYIFDRCVALTEMTIPYAGFSLEEVNAKDSTQCVLDYFNSGDKEKYYASTDADGWSRWIPMSLKKITVLGGERIPNYGLCRFIDVTDINIPDSIATIGNYGFQDCSSLKNAPVTNILTSIGDHAFENCSSAEFKAITFPKTLETLGNYAFSGCKGLTSVSVPETVKKVGEYAFSRCDKL